MIEITNHPLCLTAEEFRGLHHTDAYCRMLNHRARIRVPELVVDGVDYSDLYAEELSEELEQLLRQVVTSSMYHCARPECFQPEFTVYFNSHMDLSMGVTAIYEATKHEADNQRRRQAVIDRIQQSERETIETH